MKAVILAAGVGSRIRSLTHGAPKCLMRFGDRAILDYQIDSLHGFGVRDIAVVVGYRARDIVRHVQLRGGSNDVAFIENENFASTNNMYSLACARGWLRGAPFACLNADVLCHPELVRLTLGVEEEALALVDPDYREETTKVVVRDGLVQALRKTIPREEASGTFANLAAVSSRGAERLFERAARSFSAGEFNEFFNDVLSALIADGLRVKAVDTGGLAWAEIDNREDFAYARSRVFPAAQRWFSRRDELSSVA